MIKPEQLDLALVKGADIPTLPHSVLLVMQMIQDPHCSSSELARVITTDPGMTTKVLRLANSPYYGFRQKIGSIGQAVTLLGFSKLTNTLLSTAVFDVFRYTGTGFDLAALWKHSVATATAAKLIAKHVNFPSPEKAFTAALLHDIGKVLIAQTMPNSLKTILRSVQEKHWTMYEAEKKAIGLAHPAFGSWMLARWELPLPLIEAVEWHHTPMFAKGDFDLAAIVYLANILAHHSGIGSSGDMQPRTIDPRIQSYFHLTDIQIETFVVALQRKRLEIDSFASETTAS